MLEPKKITSLVSISQDCKHNLPREGPLYCFPNYTWIQVLLIKLIKNAMNPQTAKNGIIQLPESPTGPVWKPDLYKLQREAPEARLVACKKLLEGRPTHYGTEFHGRLSHQQAHQLLTADGDFLVRYSGPNDSPIPTLSIRFQGKVKHYRLFYDGQHFVKEKRFDTVNDLVRDGLVTLHIEANAGPYIQHMSDAAKYEKSPAYLTLTRYKRRTKPLQMTEEEEKEVHYDKPHNFKTHNFKGLNWCELCSNFLWGFSAQGVKCEEEISGPYTGFGKVKRQKEASTYCGFSAHTKCSEKLPPDCCPELKSSRSVFGVDLTTLVRAKKTVRPFVVDKCIQEIEARGLNVEGIYRISGFADEMDTLRMALERDGENADISVEVYDNINVVAGILKQYFRLLPIPLLTYEVHPALIRAVQLGTPREQIRATKDALSLLPPAHYNTLKYLMAHLAKVDEQQHTNKMSAYNLSTVFAPTLMPPPTTGSHQIPDMSGEIKAICLLIQHHSVIF